MLLPVYCMFISLSSLCFQSLLPSVYLSFTRLSPFYLFFSPLFLFLSHLCPLVYSFFLSLRLLVKRCCFLLVVIKSYFSSIRELVFERSFWCQRGSIPPVLDVPLMPSFCFPCLPTMPLLMHQPITPL